MVLHLIRMVPCHIGLVPHLTGLFPSLIGLMPSLIGLIPSLIGLIPSLIVLVPSLSQSIYFGKTEVDNINGFFGQSHQSLLAFVTKKF